MVIILANIPVTKHTDIYFYDYFTSIVIQLIFSYDLADLYQILTYRAQRNIFKDVYVSILQSFYMIKYFQL